MNDISGKIVNRLLEKEAVRREDYEIYLFGINQLLTIILDLLTAVMIGIVFGKVVQTIILVTAFMILRSHAGGYHASTPFRCYVLTAMTIIISLSAMNYIECNLLILTGLWTVSGIVILMLAPVDTENKPMDDMEYIYYRKKTIGVWGLESIAALLCAVIQFGIGTEGIVLAQTVLSVALICECGKQFLDGTWSDRRRIRRKQQ